MTSRVLVGLLCLTAAAFADELDSARRLLGSKTVSDRIRGVETLVQLDSERSIDALERALKQSNRAIDAGSRKLDKLLARQLKMLPEIRRVLRKHESGKDVEDEAEAILARLERVEKQIESVQIRTRLHLQLVRAAGAGFVRFRNPEAIAKIEQGALREPHPLARMFYIAGLRHPTRKHCVGTLLGLLDNRDARVRACAVRSLIPFAREPGVADKMTTLNGDTCWAVRLGACQVMAGAKFPEAVAFLVEAAARERGELALAADSYLYHLTGASFAQRPAHWKTWWEKNGPKVRDGTWAPSEQEVLASEGKTVASFFRIPLRSERILFALDFSGSMSEPLPQKDKRIRQLMEKHRLPATRLGYAQAEFVRAITALPDGAYFNVIGYNDDVKRFKHRMVKLTRTTRRSAIRWVVRLETSDLTNIWAALHESFADYLDFGSGKKRFEELPDTVLLLTDGIATRGRFTETEDLRALVQMWNLPLDVVFHCVGIGKEHDHELLAGLAKDTGGYYVDVTKGVRPLRPRRRKPPAGVVTAKVKLEESREKLEKLLDLLEDGGDEERLDAARELAAWGAAAEPAVELLVYALQDYSEKMREQARLTLIAIGEKAVPQLIDALGIDDADTIIGAANALAGIGTAARQALPHLAKLRDYDDADVQTAVRAALEAIGG